MKTEELKEKQLTGYPSIDKPWLKYYGQEILTASAPQGNLYEYMYEHTKDRTNNCMVFYGKKISYHMLLNNPGVNTSLVRLSEIKVPVLQKSRFR